MKISMQNMAIDSFAPTLRHNGVELGKRGYMRHVGAFIRANELAIPALATPPRLSTPVRTATSAGSESV